MNELYFTLFFLISYINFTDNGTPTKLDNISSNDVL